jgi:hypothetical protein
MRIILNLHSKHYCYAHICFKIFFIFRRRVKVELKSTRRMRDRGLGRVGNRMEYVWLGGHRPYRVDDREKAHRKPIQLFATNFLFSAARVFYCPFACDWMSIPLMTFFTFLSRYWEGRRISNVIHEWEKKKKKKEIGSSWTVVQHISLVCPSYKERPILLFLILIWLVAVVVITGPQTERRRINHAWPSLFDPPLISKPTTV